MVRNTASTCMDTASGTSGANANGAHSCISNSTTAKATILAGETFAIQEGDNDAKGDGNAMGCAVLTFNFGSNSVEQNVALAFILLAVGLFTSWLAYYLYNRYQARQAGDSKFRHDTAWQSAAPVEKKRPVSAQFSESNPGVKMGRPMKVEMSTNSGSSNTPAKPQRGGHTKIKRSEMI